MDKATLQHYKNVIEVMENVRAAALLENEDRFTYQRFQKPDYIDPNEVDPIVEAKIISKLEKEGALKKLSPQVETWETKINNQRGALIIRHDLQLIEPKFTEVYEEYSKHLSGKQSQHKDYKGWKLELLDAGQCLTKKGEIIYRFYSTQTDRYTYFSYLWEKLGEVIPYEVLFKIRHDPSRYSKKDNVYVKDTLKELRDDFSEYENLKEVEIILDRGALVRLVFIGE